MYKRKFFRKGNPLTFKSSNRKTGWREQIILQMLQQNTKYDILTQVYTKMKYSNYRYCWIDFMLTKNKQPVLCIEYDGPYHVGFYKWDENIELNLHGRCITRYQEQLRQDTLKNIHIISNIKVPVLRVHAFDIQKILKLIPLILQDKEKCGYNKIYYTRSNYYPTNTRINITPKDIEIENEKDDYFI